MKGIPLIFCWVFSTRVVDSKASAWVSPTTGSLAMSEWEERNNSGPVGAAEGNCRQQTISLNIHGNWLGQLRWDVLVRIHGALGCLNDCPNSQGQISHPAVCLKLKQRKCFLVSIFLSNTFISFLLVFADSSRTTVAHEQTLLSARRSLPWFSLSEKWGPCI